MNSAVDLNAVEIWFPVERDADNYPSSQDWEQSWAWPIGGGFRIDNVPFFAKGVARGDTLPQRPATRVGFALKTLKQLMAIDVGEENEERVWRYLQSGLDRGDWDLQVGYSPD